MSSDVEIANLALTKIGQEPIASFLDNTKQARVVNRTYAILRDELQRKYCWSFAKRYALLPALATPPIFKYGFAYQMPTDCLRLYVASVGGPQSNAIGLPGVSLNDFIADDEQDYEIVGTTINTWISAPLKIVYYAQVTDPNQFDAAFRATFACYLAFQWAEAITGSTQKKQAAGQEYTQSMKEARAVNAVELPPKSIGDDTFMASRLQS